MKKVNKLLPFLLFWWGSASAQQVADTLYSPVISNPAYSKGQAPIVLIDEAHHNFHTLND